VSTRICRRCERGQEACEWCHDIEVADFEAICDCGLHDFGDHLLDCTARADKRFVVVANYGSEDLVRP
jgi:hypothetical protein